MYQQSLVFSLTIQPQFHYDKCIIPLKMLIIHQQLIFMILKIQLKQNISLQLSIRSFIAINFLMYVCLSQTDFIFKSFMPYLYTIFIFCNLPPSDLSSFVQSSQIRRQIFYRNKSLTQHIKIINDQQLELKFNVKYIFISIKDMNQKEKGLQQIVQTSIMIKSKKQHIEKQTQELFHFFSEDYKYQDPMLLMGVRYKDKEKEFYTIKRENQELKNKTRNLAEELDNLRNSLKDGQFIGNMRESISQDIPRQINLGASNFANTREDTDVFQIRKQLISINKFKEQVFSEQKQSRKIFKERLQQFFNQLQRQHKTQLFKNYESNKIQGKGEMITIPKERYDKLIEIYSINVAENGLRQFQKKFSSQQNQKKLEQIYQEKENFIKNYSNLLQDDKIAINNLHQLFEILANRAGFEKEWERYHRENQKESVAFKYKIDNILKNTIVNEIQQKNINEKAKKQVFVEKLDNVVEAIQFSQKQRQYWKQIKDKIFADSFLNTQKIVQIARSEEESLKAEIGKMLAELISISLKESVKSFQNFMEEKLNKVIKKDEGLLDQICVAEIQKCLVQDIQLFNCKKWLEITDKIIIKKQQIIKNYQKKHFVFMSTNQIYRARAKIK